MTKWGEARRHYDAHLNDQTDECMIWPYRLDPGGYGMLWTKGRMVRVHVLSCIHHHGPRPPGMVVRHGPCHNTACWNPRHLSWSTRKENQGDRRRDGTITNKRKQGKT